MKNDKQALVPRLRFPEFRDAGGWVNESMGDLYGFYPTNTFSRDKLNYTEGRVKNIHYGDIHTKFATLFDVNNELVPFIKGAETIDRIRPESYCVEGDVIFADASEDMEDVGKSIEIVNTNNENIVSGLHTILARQLTNRLAIRFGGYLFKSGAIREQIKKEAQGAKVLGISSGRLSRIRVYYPSDRKEQKRIADCLSSLEELIAAQADKIAALKTHKKGLMQQLFPREGETLPRLRFPEFRGGDEWKTIQLQHLSTIIRGASPRPRNDPKFYGGDIPRLMGQDVSRDGKWVTPCIDFLTKEGAKLSRFCKRGTLTIICSGDVGIPSFLAVDACIHDGFLALVDIDASRVDVDYLYYCLGNLQRVFNSSATHGGIYNNLTTTILKEFTIGLPDLEEQNMIASCLSSLDSLINDHTKKFDALKSHKKGLMQQLFPSPEAVGV